MLTVYTNKQDFAAPSKNFEVNVRVAITPKTTVLYCQSQGRPDHFMNLNGKRVYIEIKAGCGKVVYNAVRTDDPMDYVDRFMEGADFIVYTHKAEDGMDIMTEAWVFTRDEFISFLTSYGKPMVKWNGCDINIQSFNSKRKEAYLWDTLDQQPTLGEWLAEVKA